MNKCQDFYFLIFPPNSDFSLFSNFVNNPALPILKKDQRKEKTWMKLYQNIYHLDNDYVEENHDEDTYGE